MWYIILFIFSLAGIGVILSIKVLEYKKGLKILPKDFINKVDQKIIDNINFLKSQVSDLSFKKVYKLTKKSIDVVTEVYLTSVKKVSKKINNKDSEMVRFVKGEKILNRNGKASKFLQDVAEHKKSLRGENIEE